MHKPPGFILIFAIFIHHYTCNAELQISYYENIEAPYKELFIFEDSAHSPIYE